METKFTKGRDLIMIEANVEPRKNTYGKVVEFIPKTDKSICDHVRVKWQSGKTSEVPAHWVSTFSCDEK